MTSVLCLLAGLLTTAPGPGPELRLARGQELVYRGHFLEESFRQGVRRQQSCDVEIRWFVLAETSHGFELACCTILRPSGSAPTAAPGSVRLELFHADVQGRLTPRHGPRPAPPRDGPPTLDTAALVALPPGPLTIGRAWNISTDGWVRSWRVAGQGTIKGGLCWKLEGDQQSDDWQRPRPDNAIAWQRRDTIWLGTQTGYARRAQRRTEFRFGQASGDRQTTVLNYELDSDPILPASIVASYRREIEAAVQFFDTLAALPPPSTVATRRQYDLLLNRIAYHADHSPPTPYRDAINWAKRCTLDARNGQPPAVPPTPRFALTVGQPAPDFAEFDVRRPEPVRLSRWQGRPVLLIFYKPELATAEPLLRWAQRLHDRLGERVHVAALAVGSPELAALQAAHWRLTIPVLPGSDVGLRYQVDLLPKLVPIDAAGILCHPPILGWGPDTPRQVEAVVTGPS